jgi:hypothetical protein
MRESNKVLSSMIMCLLCANAVFAAQRVVVGEMIGNEG